MEARIIPSILWLQNTKPTCHCSPKFCLYESKKVCDNAHWCVFMYSFKVLCACGFLKTCLVSQDSDMWLCGLTAEEFITDNYIRMCWKRNKPRTVWAGRCWASAYTVPHAPCTPASHTPAPTGPLWAWKGSRENTETPESLNQLLLFLTLQPPYISFIHCTFHTFNTVKFTAYTSKNVFWNCFLSQEYWF